MPPARREEHRAFAGAATEHRDNANPESAPAGAQPPRRARLRLTRVDPWSVMKTSFLLSIAFGVVTFVAVFMVWSVLGAAGVWDSINSTVASIVEGDQPSDFDVTNYVGMSRVLGFTLLISVHRRHPAHRHRDPGGVPLQHVRRPAGWRRGHPVGGRALIAGRSYGVGPPRLVGSPA